MRLPHWNPRRAIPAISIAIAALSVPVLANHHEEAQLPGILDTSRVAAGTYAADSNHTLVGWRLNHLGFNDYFGIFGDVSGTLTLDPANLEAASLSVEIPIASVTIASDGLAEHLFRPGKDGAAPDFFGPSPESATFVSTSVEQTGDTTALITGQLSLNGVTKPVVITAEFTGAGANPMTNAQTIGFEGRATIKRSDFGLSTFVPVVSDEVTLDISSAFEMQ